MLYLTSNQVAKLQWVATEFIKHVFSLLASPTPTSMPVNDSQKDHQVPTQSHVSYGVDSSQNVVALNTTQEDVTDDGKWLKSLQ